MVQACHFHCRPSAGQHRDEGLLVLGACRVERMHLVRRDLKLCLIDELAGFDLSARPCSSNVHRVVVIQDEGGELHRRASINVDWEISMLGFSR